MSSWKIALALALGASASYSSAQYRVIPGRVDGDGFPTTAASICLGDTGTSHCYTPPDYQKSSPFGLAPKATNIGQLNGQELTLFTATFSGGGSGDLTNYAVLLVRDGEFVNLLPKLQLTNQSDLKIWNLPEFSSLPILVTADFIWNPYGMQGSHNEQETHFGHHHYTVRVLLFDPSSARYTEKLQYTTDKEYPGLDSLDAIHVIDPERKKILLHLRKNLPQ